MAALLSVLLALLVLAAAWSYGMLARSRAAATGARADLEECRRLAAEIEGAAKRPALAAEHERVVTEVTGLVEEAAKFAQIPPEKIERITPEAARRVGDSVYTEKPTQVVLQDVTLKQVVELLHRLAASGRGLTPKSLRIVAPRGEDAGDLWTAELVVTYLIYDPPDTQRGGSIR
jgi:predicted Zn-dependent peptidase